MTGANWREAVAVVGGWLAMICAAYVGTLAGFPADAEACTPAIEYETEIVADDTPSCVRLGIPERTASTYLDVTNTCESSVEFDEVGCEDTCFEDVVVEPGETNRLSLRSDYQTDATRRTEYAWTLNADRKGLVEVEVTNEGPGDGCDGWPDTGGYPDDEDTGVAGEDAGAGADAGGESGLDWQSDGGEAEGCGCGTRAGGAFPLPALLVLAVGALALRRIRRRP